MFVRNDGGGREGRREEARGKERERGKGESDGEPILFHFLCLSLFTVRSHT